ncbi:2-dehydro-3-deoxygalactonokinase [Algoriphagus sp. H41]|uniref:2-dehydro-3-deoxygalactonokinase n=1 Tax=Algoriphagus oliviformis TaxID=2811231 RepID=A0ABS3C8J4_9BACT|nr:2-dehydro-3-deoxygalactonokinase [Algoriphagus oliviformis]MBN7813348.1 2-dehydro-3-deoxygalactonokinase [Algoriphagus oliviformis]
MATTERFVSCDWGTTNFRLRLVDGSSLEVLAQHQTPMGIKDLNDAFMSQNRLERQDFFLDYLLRQLGLMGIKPADYRVVAAGMASSSLGLKELPYAALPFSLSGGNIVADFLATDSGLDLLLISGVKSPQGVMRGEEIQAIGLEDELAGLRSAQVILPGTHSKHIHFEAGSFTGFKTYMTGELFSLLSHHSILKLSVEKGPLTGQALAAFRQGVQVGFGQGLASSLFTVRAKDVLGHTSKDLNYHYLSGILIGDELMHLRDWDGKILMAAADPLFQFYSEALGLLVGRARTILLDGKALELAMLKGQRKLMQLYERGESIFMG